MRVEAAGSPPHREIEEQKTNSDRSVLKMCIVGPAMSGKTEIVASFLGGAFSEAYTPTIGASFRTISFEEKKNKYEVLVWDTAGDIRFRPLIPMYLRGAAILLVTSDLTKESYLDDTKSSMINCFSTFGERYPSIIIAGTKTDLVDPQQATQKMAALEEFAASIGGVFIDINNKTRHNIQMLLEIIKSETIITSEIDKL